MLRLISSWSDEDSPPQNPVKGIRPMATNSSARSEAVGILSVSTTPNVRAKTVEFDRYYQRIADDMIDLYLEVSEDVRNGKYDV